MVKRRNKEDIEEERIVQMKKNIDDIFNPENIVKAEKLHRELSILSADELLRPFTI